METQLEMEELIVTDGLKSSLVSITLRISQIVVASTLHHTVSITNFTAVEDIYQPEQTEQPKSELDIEIEYPKCNEVMELHSKFDALVYFCDGCNFALKCT